MPPQNKYSPTLVSFLEELRHHGGFSDSVQSIEDSASCGDVPLHWAAYWGRQDIVEEMLALGCDVNVAGESSMTPLDYAIQGGHEALAAFITDKGGMRTDW